MAYPTGMLSFTLEDIDTTGYPAFTSGQFVPITAWSTLTGWIGSRDGNVSCADAGAARTPSDTMANRRRIGCIMVFLDLARGTGT